MSYPDAMEQDHAAPPPAAAASDQDADIGQVATAMQVVTEVSNAPATSIEGTTTTVSKFGLLKPIPFQLPDPENILASGADRPTPKLS